MAIAPIMPFAIHNTNDVATSGVKMVVYGAPDAGKTTLMAGLRDALIISSEKGLLSIKGSGQSYFTVDTAEDVEKLVTWLEVPSNYVGKYKVLCIDSISDIAERILDTQKRLNKDGRKAYGVTQDVITSLLRTIVDIQGVNVYIAAWEMLEKTNEFSQSGQMRPYLTGKILPKNLIHFIDNVLHLRIHYIQGTDATGNATVTPQRWLQCHQSAEYFARVRDRFGQIQAYEPPDLQALFDKIAHTPANT